MTAGQIRRELDQLLETGTGDDADYQRLSQAWEAIKPDILFSYHMLIEDRLAAFSYGLS